MDCQYKDKYGGVYSTRFIIQGPHYYTLVAHGKQETPAMKNFLNSFEIKPYIYGQIKERKDTALFYTVKSPVFPVEEKKNWIYRNIMLTQMTTMMMSEAVIYSLTAHSEQRRLRMIPPAKKYMFLFLNHPAMFLLKTAAGWKRKTPDLCLTVVIHPG
ncbi:MAG: hypothetical protein WDN26_02450 [Chitinophagaceae bacterium]